MQMRLELSRSALAMALDAPHDPDADTDRTLAQAKAVVGDYGIWVGQQAIQLHGGMGMVEAYPVGPLYKRLVQLDHAFGSAARHLRRLAEPQAA